MSFLDHNNLQHLIATYGYWAVALFVFVESMGIPVPGEMVLISAAIYAGTTHHLNIAWVILAAAVGAILGDNVGFWIGREFGYRVLLRYGRYIRVTEGKIKLGQYLFLCHGGKVVFFGRFVAILRTLAAFLAGVNHMPWWRFLLFNAAGGVVWVTGYGLAAYLFGKAFHRLLGPVGIGALVLAGIIVVACVVFLRRNEQRLESEAERALPGPLQPPRALRRHFHPSGHS